MPPTTTLKASEDTAWPSPLKFSVSSSVLPFSVRLLDAVELVVSLPAPASIVTLSSAARFGPTVNVSSPPRPKTSSVSVVPTSIVMLPRLRKNVTRWPLAVAVMTSAALAPLNWNVSLPPSPLTGSLPSPGFQIIRSSPRPPLCGSTPGPPVSVSLPAPPFSVSLPRPPFRMSTPSPPVSTSSPSPPSTRATIRPFSPVPPVMVSMPARAFTNRVSVVPMSIVMLPRLRKNVTRWPLPV